MTPPRLSIVVLTWNEERNVQSCLASLARQRERSLEVIVVDAASTDRTVAIVQQAQPAFPLPLRLHVAPHRLPIGEARNLGVRMARAPLVGFLSADAELGAGWTQEALRSLESCGMAFGRQVHDPRRWTVAASVRGLRYHFPVDVTADPLRYASNVAAAYRREILEAFPFDPDADAAEDLVLARRAAAAGHLAAYNPRMVARHHDAETVRAELRKMVREGAGWGRGRSDLGLFLPLLAWAGSLALAATLLALRPSAWTVALLAATVWLPALRRAVRNHHAMPSLAILKGVAASPAFDLAFLSSYLHSLAAGLGRDPFSHPAKETSP